LLRDLYSKSDISVRELARRAKVSEKTVRNRVKAEEWERKSADVPQEVRTADDLAERAETAANEVFPAAVDLAKRFCGTIEVLQAEVDTVIRHLHLIRELADAETDGDENPARARLVEKVLSLPGLVKAANELTAALSRLADAGPGKKEDAKDRAKAAGTGRFATPQAPKGATETLQ
jgi:hypothetical protein